MTRKQSTKRALMMSMVSLLLCFSMLIGTTYAWFTDSVSSANSIIKAGNLDVDVYYGDPAEKNSITGIDTLFNDVELWEPGAMAWEQLTVVNLGNLAVKYNLSVNFINATDNGNGKTLADILKVAVMDEQPTRENIKSAELVTMKEFSLGMASEKLEKQNDSKSFYMAIYWEPSAIDNEFNMNNANQGKVLTIDLGINLFATQLAYEEDSFDKYYDETAAVFTVAEANALLAENKDVNLVNCNEPANGLEVPANYTGTVVLNNVNIAYVMEVPAATTFSRDALPTASAARYELVILGEVVVKATEEGMSAISGTYLNINGNGKLTAVGKGKAAFGIGGLNTESIVMKNLTVAYAEGGEAGEEGTDTKYYKDAPEGGAAIGSGFDGADIVLKNVTVVKAIGGSKAAGIGARYHVGVNVTITDSEIGYVEGGTTAAGIGGSRVSGDASESGVNITITNSKINAKGGVFAAGIGSGYDTHCLAKQPLCTINIQDSTITAEGGKYAAGVGTGYHNAALAGEIKNSTVNATSGEKFYKNTYTAAMDVGFGITDPAREGQQTDSKLIFNGTEITLATAPNAVDPSEGLTGALKDNANISLTGGDFTLPSMAGKKNITIEGAADGSTKVKGVNSFSFGEDTTVKNVTFTSNGSNGGNSVRYGTTTGDVVYENCVFEGKQYGYHVDNANNGTITFNNCTFYGRNAFASNGTYVFNNCTFKYTYSNYNTTNIYSLATFNNCVWDSKLELYLETGAKAIVDGDEQTQGVLFISDARAFESFQQDVNWRSNDYKGKTVMLSADIDMKDAYYANWTPIGQTGAAQFKGTFDGHGYTIKNLNINSSRQTGEYYSSGLFGWLNAATVKNLTVENATVVGNHNVGVIAGYMETSGCTISNCHVINATVTGKHANDDACGDKVGVIVGHAGNAGVKVENCSAKDCSVLAGRDAGQIAGAAKTANVIDCTATQVTVAATGECTGANVNEALIGRVLG